MKQKIELQKNNFRRQKMEVLKISSKSNPNSVAGAIAGLVKESNKAEMQAIGAGALNQAVKAVAIARGFVAPSGVDTDAVRNSCLIHRPPAPGRIHPGPTVWTGWSRCPGAFLPTWQSHREIAHLHH